jgi:acetyl-CoA C-acetyltransferase
MRNVVIVSASRTAIGEFGGALKDMPVVQLGATVLKDVLEKAELRPIVGDSQKLVTPSLLQRGQLIDLERNHMEWDDDTPPITIDQVVMGNVISAGQGQNVARQAAIYAGIPKETPAFTVNHVCGSGMQAVMLAAQAIQCGQAEIVLAGGMENMSQIPYIMPKARWGARMGNAEMVDLMTFDGLHEIFYGYHMGITAENIASLYGISREEQDAFAAESHKKAQSSMIAGGTPDEIVPVRVPQRKGDPVIFEADERPRETSLEKMAKLRPAFLKKGTVTAGNASGINDGAAALLLMSEDKAKELRLEPLAKIIGHTNAGLDPAYMGLGPVPAVRKLMAETSLSMDDFDAIELNEAFAAQAIACMRQLEADPAKVNPRGSGISIGHPIGATGARILVTLLHEMQWNSKNLGLASLCIGGGQGVAMALALP